MASTEQNPMQVRALGYVIVVGLCTSCLQLEQTVTIAGNGSGSQVVTMTIPERVIEALQVQAMAHNPVRKAPDMTAVFHRAQVEKELAAAGLKLTEHKVEDARRGRRAALTARFENLEQLRRSPLCGSRADWVFTKGPLKGTIQLTYYPQGRAAWVEARQKASELQKRPNDPVVERFFAKQKAQLRGLDISVTINLPGTVLMAYGDMRETGLRQVQVRVRDEDVKTPRDLILALAPRYQVVFDGRDCKLPLVPAEPADKKRK
jgi:hypothetical protein